MEGSEPDCLHRLPYGGEPHRLGARLLFTVPLSKFLNYGAHMLTFIILRKNLNKKAEII